MSSKYTEEELAGLTDEERAVLEESHDDPEEPLEEAYGDAPESEEPEEQEDQEGSDEDSVEEPEAEAQPTADDEDVAPVYTAQQPSDVDTKLTELNAKKEELASKFDDGDITAKDYQKELDALNKQEREIEREVFKAQLAEEMRQQQQRNEWQRDVKEFLAEHQEYSKSKVLYGTLDNLVKEIARDPENAALSGPEILAKAHAQVQEAIGILVPKTATEKAPVVATKQAKKLPPTLGKLPAAESTEVAGGKFAVLDRLAETDPLRFERELSRLSDSDRERYLEQA